MSSMVSQQIYTSIPLDNLPWNAYEFHSGILSEFPPGSFSKNLPEFQFETFRKSNIYSFKSFRNDSEKSGKPYAFFFSEILPTTLLHKKKIPKRFTNFDATKIRSK